MNLFIEVFLTTVPCFPLQQEDDNWPSLNTELLLCAAGVYFWVVGVWLWHMNNEYNDCINRRNYMIPAYVLFKKRECEWNIKSLVQMHTVDTIRTSA